MHQVSIIGRIDVRVIQDSSVHIAERPLSDSFRAPAVACWKLDLNSLNSELLHFLNPFLFVSFSRMRVEFYADTKKIFLFGV